MERKEDRIIQLLDCTLRDGGNALEDEYNLNKSKIEFKEESVKRLIHCFHDSNINVIELGVSERYSEDRKGFSYYPDIESASKMISDIQSDNQMYVIGYNIPDTWTDGIPDWRPGLCRGIRVYLRYSELERSLEFSEALAAKGYKVFLQNALTMRYTERDLNLVIDAANKMGAYAVYFVDTYGYMEEKDVLYFLNFFDTKLDKAIKIGFHAHNHLNLAFSNVRTFLQENTKHDLIIDSCILGMGRGAGNLQTEIIVPYLMSNYKTNYNYGYILDACEVVEEYLTKNIWGYSIITLLSALHKTSNKYTMILRNHYKFSYSEINTILSMMPKEMKYRYTKENENTIIEMFQKSKVSN